MIEESEFIASEESLIREFFDLERMIDFQRDHDVRIERGEDWQYQCWIDNRCYATMLTPLGALVVGIEQYRTR